HRHRHGVDRPRAVARFPCPPDARQRQRPDLREPDRARGPAAQGRGLSGPADEDRGWNGRALESGRPSPISSSRWPRGGRCDGGGVMELATLRRLSEVGGTDGNDLVTALESEGPFSAKLLRLAGGAFFGQADRVRSLP